MSACEPVSDEEQDGKEERRFDENRITTAREADDPLFISIVPCGKNNMRCRRNSKAREVKGRWAVAFFCLPVLALLTVAPGLAGQAALLKKLVLAYSSTSFYDVDVKDATAAMTIWSQEIGRKHRTNVESILYNDPTTLLAHLQAGKVDFAVLRSDEYLRVVKTPDFTTAVTVVYGGKKTQRFFLLVPKESPYQNLRDLKNKSLALYKGDTIGPLYLNNLLLKERLPEIPKHFFSVSEKAKISQVMLAVFFRQSDACIINERSYETAAELNPQLKEKLRIINTSPEFLLGLGIIRNDLNADQRDEFIDTLLSLGDTPRGKQIVAVFKTDRFVFVQPSDLESLRKLIQENEQGKRQR